MGMSHASYFLQNYAINPPMLHYQLIPNTKFGEAKMSSATLSFRQSHIHFDASMSNILENASITATQVLVQSRTL